MNEWKPWELGPFVDNCYGQYEHWTEDANGDVVDAEFCNAMAAEIKRLELERDHLKAKANTCDWCGPQGIADAELGRLVRRMPELLERHPNILNVCFSVNADHKYKERPYHVQCFDEDGDEQNYYPDTFETPEAALQVALEGNK